MADWLSLRQDERDTNPSISGFVSQTSTTQSEPVLCAWYLPRALLSDGYANFSPHTELTLNK